MRHWMGCTCACHTQRLLKLRRGRELKEAYPYYTSETYYVPCSLCQCLERRQAVSSSFSASLNEWLGDMAPGPVVGLVRKSLLQSMSKKFSARTGLNSKHIFKKIGAPITQHKIWLWSENQAIVKLVVARLLNINSVFVLLLLKQTFYVQRKKYNPLTMGCRTKCRLYCLRIVHWSRSAKCV